MNVLGLRRNCFWPKIVTPSQGSPKLVPRRGNLGQLEVNLAAMAVHLHADLHQLLPQRGVDYLAMEPASSHANQRARQVKIDRIDVAASRRSRDAVYVSPRHEIASNRNRQTMPPTDDDNTLSVQIANQFINVANARLEDGVDPLQVALGLRHAAANFSAFVTDLGEDEGEFNEIVEGFAQMLEYYIKRKRPGDAGGTGSTGLNQLIEQAKNEL